VTAPPIAPGVLLRLDVERPAVGGRMIARHEGRIVLVAGAIPGERVSARVEKVSQGVVLAEVAEVLEAVAARRPVEGDPACGGLAYAHIAYEEQRRLKSQVVADALLRVGRIPLEASVPVAASPERGYRMRARFHVRDGRAGWFREGTHRLCAPGRNGQVRPEMLDAIDALLDVAREHTAAFDTIEVMENLDAAERALHVTVWPGASTRVALPAGALPSSLVTGVSASRSRSERPTVWEGVPWVTDPISQTTSRAVRGGDRRLRRHAASFFQANRFLLAPLADAVIVRLAGRPVVDLYAGVGLFALAAAASGTDDVIAVEGDGLSAQDLEENGRAFAGALRVVHASVEQFLGNEVLFPRHVLLVDPPRTGMSRKAMDGVLRCGSPAVLYMSCDVATLARDLRRLLDAGYVLAHVEAFDLFPGTSHIETLAFVERA
jgi:23S rRNA (uracil1939-C5)-methyltransferase